MKPRRRVGLRSPSRRRIQSLDIMTSCSSLLIQTTSNLRLDIVQHGPPPFWTKDLFSGPLFVMLFILHSKWKICVKSNSHFAVEEADVYSFGIVALEIVSGRSNTTYRPKEECIYRLDWVISTTFFIVFVISEFSHSYPSRLIA
ncbi:putative LRR receptor-like serine/threonine-protein kinase [Vitis vinifera]|uniref:Putative LRR receptor-like serine/threonine-protein kinase n=1 Tax=Vitis vinifera TaxID=29760 RepID=A0A438ENF5_VITVI|nr:putative LRR receptor-like serine/threonine-protein kinase [Vitis vinifera]